MFVTKIKFSRLLHWQKDSSFYLQVPFEIKSIADKIYCCILLLTYGIFNFADRIRHADADVAQLVEHNLAKVGVASSSLVVRSI